MNDMKTLKVFKYIGFGILGIGFVFLVIWGVMALWNWLIPSIFNGLLSKILLTGIAPGGGHHGKSYKKDWRRTYHGKYGSWCEEAKEETAAPEV
jgi:hypothetical protein